MFDFIAENPLLHSDFQIPFWVDVVAMFLFAVTGAIKAVEKGYDFVGALTVAIVTGAGGGVLRDVFLNVRPVLLQDAGYLLAIFLATVVGSLFARSMKRLGVVLEFADALGLAIYAVVGSLKGIHAGLAFPAAVLLGTVNATGGGLLRDVLVRDEPVIFKPGQMYYLVALFASAVFAAFVLYGRFPSGASGTGVVIVAFILRLLVIRYNWQTRPLQSVSAADYLAVFRKGRLREEANGQAPGDLPISSQKPDPTRVGSTPQEGEGQKENHLPL